MQRLRYGVKPNPPTSAAGRTKSIQAADLHADIAR